MDRPACMVLRSSVLPSFRYCCRVYGGSFEAGDSADRPRAARAGCLSWHSRHNGSSGCSCGALGRWANRPGAGRRGCGWGLRCSTRASSGSTSHSHVPRRSDRQIASQAGADDVLLTGENLVERIRASAPNGVDHIVEVAFGANIKTDTEVLAQGGSITTYATNTPTPETPVWQPVFVNARLFFVGNDDVPAEAKIRATRDIDKSLEAGWKGLDIAEIVPLDQIPRSHELVEHPAKPGRVIVSIR
jgi:NADPH2:quinone reductase